MLFPHSLCLRAQSRSVLSSSNLLATSYHFKEHCNLHTTLREPLECPDLAGVILCDKHLGQNVSAAYLSSAWLAGWTLLVGSDVLWLDEQQAEMGAQFF